MPTDFQVNIDGCTALEVSIDACNVFQISIDACTDFQVNINGCTALEVSIDACTVFLCRRFPETAVQISKRWLKMVVCNCWPFIFYSLFDHPVKP